MCLCKDHKNIRDQIAQKPRPINPDAIPTLVRQAVDCHFFYNRSTLDDCAHAWELTPDEVKMVSDSNIRLYSSFYEILRQGESLELMPNSKWFLWAERDRYRKRPQNLVYDEEAIKRERDRRKEPNKSEWERRTTIENTLKSSDLFRDPTFMVADLELCLRVGTLMRNRNLTESALEMCLSAPAVLQRIEDLIQDWRKTSTQE